MESLPYFSMDLKFGRHASTWTCTYMYNEYSVYVYVLKMLRYALCISQVNTSS